MGLGLPVSPSCFCQPVSLKSMALWVHKGLDYVRLISASYGCCIVSVHQMFNEGI